MRRRSSSSHEPYSEAKVRSGARAEGLEHARERGPLDVLHREVVEAAVAADVVDLHDAGVLELGDRERLAPEAIDVGLLEREPGAQDLERHRTAQLAVLRQPDERHAAAAELAHQSVATQHEPGRERHGRARRAGEAGLDHLEAALEPGARGGRDALEEGLLAREPAGGEEVGVLGHQRVELVV